MGSKAAQRAYYERNKEAIKAKSAARKKTPEGKACERARHKLVASIRRGMLDYMKRAYGCVDCGTKEGRLDYDHRDGEPKLFALACGLTRSWESIWAEVQKCDVRCFSCHTRRHVEAGKGVETRWTSSS